MDEPETKRRKVTLSDDVIEDVNTCLIEKLISDMKESTNNLTPILGNDALYRIPLTEMYSATILDKKLIYTVIMQLNEILPLTEHQYLKRVHANKILLYPVDRMAELELRIYFSQNKFNFNDYFEDEIKIVQVVSAPPLTRTQYEMAIKYWPCNFHPNKHLEHQLSGNYFNEQEIRQHRKYMQLAYEVAEMYEDNLDCVGCDSVADTPESVAKDFVDKTEQFDLIEDKETVKKRLKELKGVVVVDPTIDSIVAVGYDRRKHNPCQHPVMIAIDNVAKSQNGGVWTDNSMFAEELSDEKVERVLDGVPRMFRNILNASHNNLKFGAKPTRRRDFIADGEVEKSSPTCEDMKDANGNDDNCEKEMEKNPADGPKLSGPYLCTGYDVYTTNEPCLMCSMALIHGRAKRIFYGIKNEEAGALNSNCKLHTISHLNHHFEVFTGFFDL